MYLQKAIQKRKTTPDFLKQVYNLSVFQSAQMPVSYPDSPNSGII